MERDWGFVGTCELGGRLVGVLVLVSWMGGC